MIWDSRFSIATSSSDDKISHMTVREVGTGNPDGIVIRVDTGNILSRKGGVK